MTEHKIAKFSTNTPKVDQNKLEKYLKALTGVKTVELHPERSTFSISYRDKQVPKQVELEAAVSKAGFTLEAPKVTKEHKAPSKKK